MLFTASISLLKKKPSSVHKFFCRVRYRKAATREIFFRILEGKKAVEEFRAVLVFFVFDFFIGLGLFHFDSDKSFFFLLWDLVGLWLCYTKPTGHIKL